MVLALSIGFISSSPPQKRVIFVPVLNDSQPNFVKVESFTKEELKDSLEKFSKLYVEFKKNVKFLLPLEASAYYAGIDTLDWSSVLWLMKGERGKPLFRCLEEATITYDVALSKGLKPRMILLALHPINKNSDDLYYHAMVEITGEKPWIAGMDENGLHKEYDGDAESYLLSEKFKKTFFHLLEKGDYYYFIIPLTTTEEFIEAMREYLPKNYVPEDTLKKGYGADYLVIALMYEIYKKLATTEEQTLEWYYFNVLVEKFKGKKGKIRVD